MAGRILPVRDRVITAIQRRLLTIKETAGYAHTLTGVYRRPGDVWHATVPPEAYIYLGRSRMVSATGSETSGTQDRIYEAINIQIRAFASSLEEDVDRTGAILLSDISRALCTVAGPIPDPFYANGDIYVVPKGTQVAYPPRDSGYVVALYYAEVRFWHKATDDRLWDDADSLHAEEELQGLVEP